MRSIGWVIVGCVVIASQAKASLFSVDVPELKGVYSTTGVLGPNEKNVSIDFGTAFERIDRVYVHAMGTVAPGLVRGHSVIGDETPYEYEVTPGLDFMIHPAGSYLTGAVGGRQEEGTFELDIPLVKFFMPDWSFLLDGKADLDVSVSGAMFLGTEAAMEVVPGLVGLTSVTVYVDGVAVPEPSLALVGLSGLAILGCRRRR